MNIKTYMLKVGSSAKEASVKIATATSEQKNIFLEKLAEIILINADDIIKINKKDIDNAIAINANDAFIDRLTFNHLSIKSMADGLIKVVKLNDLIGQHLDFKWEKYRFVLITGHRRENFGGGFLSICEAIKSLAVAHPDVRFVYPVHLNPNVQNPVNNLLANLDNVYLIPPLDYEPFVMLLKHCYLVLTDSGGIQEEAPSLGKPVLVMRNVTERPEAVDAGTVKLVGANAESIVSNIDQLLTDTDTYAAMSRAHNPYGDGSACSKIVKIIMEKLYDKL